ncbi:hypothetical protein G9A89_002062 [Geosiphon pyriformis]|nr:hypothetical protein G9A89_002062 [Geosiphon pyriformis]
MDTCNSGQPHDVNTFTMDNEESLMASFRSAAQAVTELYTKGQNQKRQAYHNGYQKCLEDLMSFLHTHHSVQQQRSQNGGHSQQALVNANISAAELCSWAQSKHNEAQAAGTSSRHQTQQHSPVAPQQQGQHQHQYEESSPQQPQSFQSSTHTMYNQPNQREIDNIDTGQEGGIGNVIGNDSLKRRFTANEQIFLGRPVDPVFEQASKRGRTRKEE